MIRLDNAALRAARVNNMPFRHLVVADFVPPDTLSRVTGDLPAIHKGGSFPIASLAFGAAAAELMAYLEGDAFREIIADRFDLDLRGAPTMVTLRGQSRDKDGRIHRDSAAKRVTVLLYLNPAADAWQRQEGCLRLLRSPDDLEDFAVEVPPVNGTLLAFPNGPTTWHGHRKFVGQRYVVQLNYMAGDGAARAELRRHRLSAMVKRLVPA